MLIKPSIGRVVWFHPGADDHTLFSDGYHTLAAIVAFVHSDAKVNLCVFAANGQARAYQSIPLIQDGETPPPGRAYCEWMPFQKGQAAKTEAAEAKLAATDHGAAPGDVGATVQPR